MPSSKALLDTTTLSAIMKSNSVVIARARDYLAEHETFTFSILTRSTALVHDLSVVIDTKDHFRLAVENWLRG